MSSPQRSPYQIRCAMVSRASRKNEARTRSSEPRSHCFRQRFAERLLDDELLDRWAPAGTPVAAVAASLAPVAAIAQTAAGHTANREHRKGRDGDQDDDGGSIENEFLHGESFVIMPPRQAPRPLPQRGMARAPGGKRTFRRCRPLSSARPRPAWRQGGTAGRARPRPRQRPGP